MNLELVTLSCFINLEDRNTSSVIRSHQLVSLSTAPSFSCVAQAVWYDLASRLGRVAQLLGRKAVLVLFRLTICAFRDFGGT